MPDTDCLHTQAQKPIIGSIAFHAQRPQKGSVKMYINQLAEGSELELSVRGGKEFWKFPSKILHAYGSPYKGFYYIGAEPVISD